MKFMCHAIHPFKVQNLMVFSIFAEFYNRHHINYRTFHHLKKKLYTIYNYSPFPPLGQALIHLLSVSIDLPLLDVAHRWNYIICALLCLASLTEPNIFQVNPVVTCINIQSFFIAKQYFIIQLYHILFIQFMGIWIFSTQQLLQTMQL